MKILKLFILLTAIILFDSCRSDEFEQEPGTNPINSEITVVGNLNGLVVDKNQQPVSDALIEMDGLTTTSDRNGVFIFKNATALSTGSLVKVKKDGYYDGFKFTSFEPGQNSVLKVEMVDQKLLTSFFGSEEATVDVNGAQIFLPANITTLQDGTPYLGIVNVKAHWYDPSDPNTIAAMPGDLRGVDAEGLGVQLTTYGMMAVELTDFNGEELKLKDGMFATLTFPLPENANGPDEIPMWHLNEATGVWLEEGKAIKSGTDMIAKVSHFSFWNCDEPYELIHLRGSIISNPGDKPLSGLQVIITDNDQMISGYGFTNSDGVFSGLVPKGNDLSMSVLFCDDLKVFKNIGTFYDDTDLGNILLDINEQLNITASMVDCDDAPVNEGYALISTDHSYDLVPSNNGQINYTIFPCNEGTGKCRAYDYESNILSDEKYFDLGETFVDLEEFEICNDSMLNGIILSFQGEEVTFHDVDVAIVDDTYLYITAQEPGPIDYPTKSITIRYFLPGASLPHVWSQNQIVINGKFGNATYHGQTVYPGNTWYNLEGQEIGDEVTGIIDNNTTSKDVTLIMNVKINQIVTTPQVTGHVCVDPNGNGIREAGENDPIPAGLAFYPQSNTDQHDPVLRLYYYHQQVNPDGSFCIKGLVKDIEYHISTFGPVADFQVTKYQEGFDKTIDNDFIFEWNDTEHITNRTSMFTLGDKEILPNIGIGLLK